MWCINAWCVPNGAFLRRPHACSFHPLAVVIIIHIIICLHTAVSYVTLFPGIEILILTLVQVVCECTFMPVGSRPDQREGLLALSASKHHGSDADGTATGPLEKLV